MWRLLALREECYYVMVSNLCGLFICSCSLSEHDYELLVQNWVFLASMFWSFYILSSMLFSDKIRSHFDFHVDLCVVQNSPVQFFFLNVPYLSVALWCFLVFTYLYLQDVLLYAHCLVFSPYSILDEPFFLFLFSKKKKERKEPVFTVFACLLSS